MNKPLGKATARPLNLASARDPTRLCQQFRFDRYPYSSSHASSTERLWKGFVDMSGIQLRSPQLPLIEFHKKREIYFLMEVVELVYRQRMMSLFEPNSLHCLHRKQMRHWRMAIVRSKICALL